jgi:ankyrin repeat protein
MVELRHAVAVDIGSGGLDDGEISHTDSHTETILDACVGLAVFDKKGDVIRLVHQTTWEYLSSQQAQLDVDSGLLTRTCLTYLSFDVFDIEVQSAFKSKSELQRKYPFYTYAALNWGHHVRDEIAKPKHDRDIEEQVHKFLSSDTKLHNSVQIMFGGHFPRPIHRLHVAATFGLQDIVLQLLNENANIHATDDYGWTALHRAAENGRDEMVSLLIERGADVNAATASKDGFSPVPFHDIAALPFFKVTVQLMNDVLRRFTNVHVDIIGILKDSNFFLFDAFDNFLGLENESTGPIAAGSEGISGGTPLHAACANGHVNSVKVLLDHEARVNANCMGAGGFIGTALHEAVFSGQKDVAQMLLERKANPNAIGVLGRDGLLDGTPVHFAALLGYDRVVECLLMNGADIDAYMEGFLIEGTALSLATFMGHENVVRALLRHVPGPDVHAGIRGLLCGTAIHLAALMGQENIVRLLLEQKDINVNYCAKGREVGRTTVAAMLMKTLLPAFAEVFLPDFGTHLNLFRSSLLQLESTLQIGLTGTALHFATAAGSGAVIQLLLEAGADVETTDDDGLTSLHLAVLGGHSKVVQQLLDKNANINAEKKLHQAIYRQPQTLLGRLLLPLVEAGMGALHMAASNGDPKLVRDLLRSGADINAATISGRMATHVAAQRGSHEAIRLLLQHGASISGEGMEGWTALHEAASCGRITVVEVLVNEGFEINKNDVFGSTALHEAARNEQHSVVQYLLENGADINQMDSYGRSAMHMAVSNRNTLVARLLVRHGGVVALEDGRGWTPLHEAINNRNYEMVQFLLEKGANVNAKSESGYTALHVAARTAQLALAQLLLENGAEAAEKDNDGNTSTDMGLRLELLEGTHTALYLAVKDGNEDAVRWLLSKEVVIDAETAKRQTALHEAAGLGHERIAKLLMDSSADLNKADESGRTPLHYAVRNGHASVVRLFLESGTDINVDAEAKGRRTPLHEAAEQGRKALVRLLLDSKATLDKADASGRTPLYYAARCGHYPVVKFLLSRGANVDAKACEITPLRIAVFYAHDYIVGLLEPGQKALHVAVKGEPKVVIQRVLEKTSVDAVNSSGQTALHVAVELDKTDVVELLLNARANTTVRDNDGQTALDKAVSMGRKHIEDLFQTLRH